MAKRGAPEFPYTLEMAKRICKATATCAEGMEKICKDNPDFPKPTTIQEWRYDYPDFAGMYLEAKRKQSELLAEEIIGIADDSTHDEIITSEGQLRFNSEYAARSKLRMDARKWVAARLAPRIYGDKPETPENAPATQADVKKVQADIAKLLKKNAKEY